MATLKEVQSKIVSVKKTKQITSAMKMVATSRLRGAQTSMEAFQPYAGKFAEVLGSIAGSAGEDASPLLIPREDVKKVAIIVCTSDRGLCGGFNVNLTSKAEKIIKSDLEGKDVSFTCFGKKARDWARKQPQPIEDEFITAHHTDEFIFNGLGLFFCPVTTLFSKTNKGGIFTFKLRIDKFFSFCN